MKEQLYTIPLMDAYRADEECPFCFIERALEQHAMDFTLGPGASYMEDDIRAQTDRAGFCREHYRQMFAYGNRLGSALILETHLKKLAADLKEEMKHYTPGTRRGSFHLPFGRKAVRKDGDAVPGCGKADGKEGGDNVVKRIRAGRGTCYICEQIRNNYDRYLATFLDLFRKKEPEFLELVKHAKGYCLPHFADLLETAGDGLKEREFLELRQILFPQMEESLERILGDVDWFQKKFDYRFQDAEWKDARDAVQRAMQKAGSGYPADPPYVSK